MSRDPAAYVRGLDLPDAPRRRDRGPMLESVERGPSFGTGPEAVAVGTQLAEFSPTIDPAQRAAVADCLLLAQLAANKAAGLNADVMAWYAKYVEVLQNIGWTTHSMEFKDTAVGDAEGGVHKAILPVLSAMLGPAAAATSLVVSVLKGLQEMDADSPWITIFDKSSSHASGAKFQLGSVGLDAASGRIEAKLLALAIDAQKKITQVLFFKLSREKARLRTADGHFTIDPLRLAQIMPAVSAKVQPFLVDNIGKIDV